MIVPKSHPHRPPPDPACPSPPPHPPASAPLRDPRSTPLPLDSGTGSCHRFQMGWGWSVRPGPLASPRDAGTCREEQLRLPAHWLGETKNRVSSASPSPSRTLSAPPPPPAIAALTSYSGLPRLHAGSPVVGLGGSASAAASSGQARGGGCGLWRREPGPPLGCGLGRPGRTRWIQTREAAGARQGGANGGAR